MKIKSSFFIFVSIAVGFAFIGISTISQLQNSSANNFSLNILRTEWLDSPKKQETFKHCAELLRLAIDTNQIQMIYVKLTNKPAVLQRTSRAFKPNESTLSLQEASSATYFITNSDIIDHLEKFTPAVLNLSKYADLLTNKMLNTYILQRRQFCANIQNPDNTNEMFSFLFFGESGPVQQIEYDVKDRGGARMEFYDNGKLKNIVINEGSESMNFKQDGQLADYFCNIYPKVAVDVIVDESNNVQILSYFLDNLQRVKIK